MYWIKWQIETTELKAEKAQESRAIAQRVSNLIHQQSGAISQAIQGYAERQPEREVKLLAYFPQNISLKLVHF